MSRWPPGRAFAAERADRRERPDTHGRISPWARYWLVALILVASYAAIRGYRSLEPPSALKVYLRTAERIVGGEEIYRTDEEAFTYPPFFALPFVPLALLPVPAATVAWNVLNGLLMAATIAALASAIRPVVPERARRVLTPWVLLTILLSARLVIAPVEKASHDVIVLALLVAAMLASLRRCRVIMGALLGVATACKATPLLFLPVLLVRRQWRASIAFVLACIAATLLPDLLFPSNAGQPWAVQWYRTFASKVEVRGAADVEGAWSKWNHHNQNLAGTLHRLTAPEPPGGHIAAPGLPLVHLGDGTRAIVTLGALGLILAVTVAASWRSPPPSPDERPDVWNHFATWGAVVSAMLLLSPMSSKYHFSLLVIPIMLAALAVVHYPSRMRPLLAAGLAVVLLLSTFGAKDLIGERLTDLLLAYGSLAAAALACWVMALALQLRPPAGMAASPSDIRSASSPTSRAPA